MNELHIIETERLILRPLIEEDAEEAFKNWTGDPEVAKFMRWDVHKSVDETREWIKSEVDMAKEGGLYDWAFVLKETGELIGSGGFIFSEDAGLYELGYNIMKKYWNRGYATEAAQAIVKFAVNELKLKKLYCCHAKDNTASGRVMEKAGFVYWRDGSYESRDGNKKYACREYLFECGGK